MRGMSILCTVWGRRGGLDLQSERERESLPVCAEHEKENCDVCLLAAANICCELRQRSYIKCRIAATRVSKHFMDFPVRVCVCMPGGTIDVKAAFVVMCREQLAPAARHVLGNCCRMAMKKTRNMTEFSKISVRWVRQLGWSAGGRKSPRSDK